jgi:hypothetical protein
VPSDIHVCCLQSNNRTQGIAHFSGHRALDLSGTAGNEKKVVAGEIEIILSKRRQLPKERRKMYGALIFI